MARSFTVPYTDEYTELHFDDRLAVVTVDTQNDWVQPGALYYIERAASIVPSVARLAAATRQSRSALIHVIRLYAGDGSNADLCRIRDLSTGRTSCLPGSDGAELVDSLKPTTGTRLDADLLLSGEFQELGGREYAAYKPRFGAFSNAGFGDKLRALGIDSLLVCGVSFPRCVLSTLFGAIDHDFRVGLVTDATAEVDETEFAFLKGIGLQALTTQEAIERISAPPVASLGSAGKAEGQ